MKILILHQHFKLPVSGGAVRSYYLAKALVEKGHKVTVITAFNEAVYRKEVIEGMEVHYLPIAYENKFSFFQRSKAFISYLFNSARQAQKIQSVDLCYAISVPLTVGLVARWLKFRKKIPYIFEVGDLWPDAPIQMGFIRNPFFARILYVLEKSIYKKAKEIVALSPAIKNAIEMKIPGKTVHLITNMADTDFFSLEKKNSDLEDKFSVKGKFVISYIGSHGVANGLDYLLTCAKVSRDAFLPIHFLLCGEGAMEHELKSRAKELGLKNISFLGFLNHEKVREVMNVTDAVFVCYRNVPILETGSPNKFFDGLAAGKLVIINFGGWIKNELETYECGLVLNPHHPEDFPGKISAFISDPSVLKKYQQSSRLLAETRYSRRLLSATFTKLFS